MEQVYIFVMIAIAAITSLLSILLKKKNNPVLNLTLKAASNFVIIYLAVMAFALNQETSPLFESMVLLGLVAGAFADLFLSFNEFKLAGGNNLAKLIFLSKIISVSLFVLAIIYLTQISWLWGLILGTVLTIIAIFSETLFKFNLYKTRYVIVLYAVLLGTLIGQCAFELILKGFSLVMLLSLLAFVFLLIADFCLAQDFFSKTQNKADESEEEKLHPITSIFSSSCYYISQILLACMIFFI